MFRRLLSGNLRNFFLPDPAAETQKETKDHYLEPVSWNCLRKAPWLHF
jgi:hypothetical protein